VLATTDPQKVPPTVLSRCLQFNLRPMAPATMHEHLEHVLRAEGIESDPGALRLLARAAQGSMRDALSLTDQAIAYGAGRLEEHTLRHMLGAVDRSHALRAIEALAAGDGAALVATADELRALGLSASGLLEELAALLQQMAVVQAVPQAADESDPDTPTLVRLAGLLAADETQLYYSIVLRGREELALAPDEYSGLVMVLLRMLAFRPADAGEQPTARRSQPAAVVSGARATAVAPSASAGVAQPDAMTPAVRTASPCADRWAEVVAQLVGQGAIAALVRELAMQSQCVAIETDDERGVEVWRLRAERDALRAPAQRDKLQAALAGLLGRPMQLEIEAGVAEDTPGLREAASRAQRQAEAERTIENDPFVQSLKQQFKSARIVPGSVKTMEQRS
jgi:DNA polymerase-3 subunit gamma/tau